jgi:hypothetical protein
MNNSFAPIVNNKFSRKWSGNLGAVDPYITGHFFTRWVNLPPNLGDAIGHPGDNAGVGGGTNVAQILEATCLSVSNPASTVNRAEFTGLGGTRWAVPTNVDEDNTITCRFLEFSSLPIYSIMHGWVRLIRDYRTGTAEFLRDEYTHSSYAAAMYYWTTRPDGQTIEYYSCFTGIFPLRDPADLFGSDITTYDKVEIDIDFNVHWRYHEPWVKTKCQTYMSALNSDRSNPLTGYKPQG